LGRGGFALSDAFNGKGVTTPVHKMISPQKSKKKRLELECFITIYN